MCISDERSLLQENKYFITIIWTQSCLLLSDDVCMKEIATTLCSHLASFLTRKVDERFFNEKQSWQRLLQIAAESAFCCHSNSCNSSLALCAAEMSRKSKKLALALAFEVNGKENVDSQRRLRPFFFLLLWKRQISLLACHWSAVKKALDVGLRAAEKDAGGGVLKSAQDIFENTVYSVGL